jgi:hypothetical protein
VFWLGWDTNSPAIAELLVAVSSHCWHLMAVEEGRSDRGHIWSKGGEKIGYYSLIFIGFMLMLVLFCKPML